MSSKNKSKEEMLEENEKSLETESEETEEVLEEEELVPLELTENQKVGALEALLFTTGDSIRITKLAECMECSKSEIDRLLDRLARRYSPDSFGLTLLRFEDSVQLASKRDYYNVLRRLISAPRRQMLSETVLETLSIVAYKQPVTRVEIEKIRGVACGHQINKLLEYDLIKELGRLDAPGKPLLFGTTEQFLKSFDVSSIDELPQATPERIADFQAEAEREVQEVKV